MSGFVTGATGFIVYNMCEALLTRGESVIGLYNIDPYLNIPPKFVDTF